MTGWLILFAVLGFLLLLLALPIRFCFSFREELKLTVWIAFVPLRILPPRPQPKENRKAASKKRSQVQSSKQSKPTGKPNFFSELKEEKGLKGFLAFLNRLLKIVLRAVGRIGRHLIGERFEAELAVGGADSAAIPERYGTACAIVFPVWSQLLSLTRCRKHQLQLEPDFLSETYRISCKIRIRIRVFWIVRAAVAALASFVVLMLREKMSAVKEEKNHAPNQQIGKTIE